MKSDKKEFYSAVFVSVLVLSNILSVKLIAIGPLIVPGGVVCYAVTYLVSDIIGERYGRQQAGKMVVYGLMCQIICTTLIVLARSLPGSGKAGDATFDRLFSTNVCLTAASLAAYAISQSVDIALFHGIRDSMLAKGWRCKWLWNNISTLTSQVIDTIVYVGIAFGLGQGLSIDLLLRMAVSQIIVKAGLAIADTPLFYLCTKKGGIDGSNYH